MRPSAREFAEFNGLLCSVVEKGLPLPPAMDLMAGVVRDRALKEALGGVARALRDGASLPDALGKYPDAFPLEYCALIRAGLDGNRLAEVLRTTQVHQLFRARLYSKVKRILLYFLAGAIIGELVLLMTVFVGRQFEQTFLVLEHDMEIHSHTEFGNVVRSYARSGGLLMVAFPFACGLLIAAYWIIQRWARVGWIGYVIPVWGPVQKSRDLALFCCAMGLRLRSGAALPDALRAGRDSVYNRRFRRLGEQVLRRVEEGESLSTALYYLKFFPKTMAWGISLGEENGELPRAFDTFAELYTAQMERSFEMVFQVLTPLGILAIGNLALVSAMMVIAPLLEIIQVSMNLSYR